MALEIRQLIQQGTTAFEAGEYGEAEPLLREAAERAPNYANVFNMLGVIASHQGAPEKAVEMFRQALRRNPNYSEAQINLAITLADMGAYEQAAHEVGDVQSREPGGHARLGLGVLGKLANAHAELARKYHLLGMYAEAVREYDNALSLCPKFPDMHNRRAISCREAGDLPGAKSSFLRALELNPKYVEAYVNLGLLYQKLGQVADAAASWERALALDPSHQLARIYRNQVTTPRTDE